MYRQIAEDLREQIESGQLRPGLQVPTELELRERYSASRNTIREALRLLTTRGLIVARAGQGTFVSERSEPFVTTLSEPYYRIGRGLSVSSPREEVRYSVSSPRVEIQQALEEIAPRLGLPLGSEVVSREEVRSIDGVVWSLQTSFYPRELVTRGAERLLGSTTIESGSLAYLYETLGLKEVGYTDLIRVGPPNQEEARLFRLPDDGSISVITVLRTSYGSGDPGPVPFRVTITAFPADRNLLVFNSGEVPTAQAILDELSEITAPYL
jgi:GntR family transcriptional regulator